MMQTGQRPVYEKPEKFFALTYPTYNLRDFVREVALRLAGKNDKAVRQLALTYGGGKTHKGGYQAPMQIPKATGEVVFAAIAQAVQAGQLWLLSLPATLLAEAIPPGVLSDPARLRPPPPAILPADILPENLPNAWKDGNTTAISIATALSQKQAAALPWKTIRDVIQAALAARFIEHAPGSGPWPCEYPAAQAVKLKLSPQQTQTGGTGGQPVYDTTNKILVGATSFEPAQLQDLAEIAPELLDIKAKTGVPIHLYLRIEAGDGKDRPAQKIADQVNETLAKFKKDFRVS